MQNDETYNKTTVSPPGKTTAPVSVQTVPTVAATTNGATVAATTNAVSGKSCGEFT